MTRKVKPHKTKSQAANTAKRAAIYVRVSSEKQAEGVSPQTQEADCRAYCESRGYIVVEVYRDTEKYRVGGRMVEPSGTRGDRPELRRMLADTHGKRFEVIIAWREDRLYRSYRPMLDVLECIEQTAIDIELVKETFDRRIAPVKAWAARMELDAKHDRMLMGVAGRLAQGKAWNTALPFGYTRTDGVYQVEPHEAEWVNKIWRWYGNGVSVQVIRARLIEAGVPQKRGGQRYIWPPHYIRRMLRHDYYHTGKIQTTWGNEVYETPIPPIIDAETAQCVAERKARYKSYPAGNSKAQVDLAGMAAGKVYCAACNVRMGLVTVTGRHCKYLHYKCYNYQDSIGLEGCAKSCRAPGVDADVWRKLWELFSEPGKFEQLIETRIAQLQVQEKDAKTECERLERQLDDLLMKRQQVITWALEKKISQQDMKLRLTGMDLEQAEIEYDLSKKRVLTGDQAQQLLQLAEEFRRDVRDGAVGINDIPETPEQAKFQFEMRRKYVERLVTRVDVLSDKTVEVRTEIALKNSAQIKNPGVC